MRANQRRHALAAAVAGAFVALAIVTAGIPAEPPVVTPTPSAAISPSSAPIVDAPRAVFTRSVVVGGVPGGGLMTTQAYDAFVILSAGRPSQSHPIAGVAVGTPVFDGRDRVAYWRVASIAATPFAPSGPFEVVVMDVRAGRERVLLSLADERSNGGLLWSADRRSLVIPTRTAPGSTSSVQNRLIIADADTGAVRVLHVSSGDASVGPLFADAQVVVGVRGNSYTVLDATSGAVRTQTPMRVPSAFLQQWAEFSSDAEGNVVELHRRYESEAGPLWIWNVRDPGTDIAKVDQHGMWDPIFWPGRTEVVFSGATGLTALDYRTGLSRQLVSSPGVHRIVAIESGGRYALAQTESKLQILERTGDDLKARPDLSFAAESLLHPLGVFLP
jgi:hypothetical protein